MSEDNNSTHLASDSPVSEDGAVDLSTMNPDEGIDAIAAEFLQSLEAPGEDPVEEEQPLEVSEDEEQEHSEDESPVEDEAETEEEEMASEEEVPEDESSEELPVVDYDEAKNFKFEFDGQTYTASQLKSALGRQAEHSKALNEVKSTKEAIEAEKAALAEQKEAVEKHFRAAESAHQLGSKQARIQEIQNSYREAYQQQDTHKMTMLEASLKFAKEDFNNAAQQVQQAEHERNQARVQAQATKLRDKGYGDLLSDSQRLSALSEYLQGVSEEAYTAANYDADLLILAEKARMWDKSQQKGKGKLVGNKPKTLKGGSGNVSSAPKRAQQKARDDFRAGNDDAMLEDFAKQMLGL